MKIRYLYIISFLFIISCNSKEPNHFIDNEKVGKFIDDWTYEVFVGTNTNNAKAVFRLWIPEGITPKSILMLTPGGFGNGIGLANLNEWQLYAREKKLALLGVYVTSTSISYTDAVFTALQNISKERNVEFVNDLPFLLRGFSSGGRFSQTFASSYPNKTIAYANIKGLPSGDDISKSIAQLIIVGGNDTEHRKNSLKTEFYKNRNDHKIACYALEPNEGHSIGKSDELIKDFFSAVLKKRLNNNGNLTENDIFLGNVNTFEYSLFSDYSFNKKEASCLIDEDFSIKWKKFMEGN